MALRPGLGTAAVLGSQGLGLLAPAGKQAQLGVAFLPLARFHLRDPFLLYWVKPFCFLITRLGMEQTSVAAMASLFGEWFDPDAALDYPIGGSRAGVEDLVRGLARQAGRLQCRSPVVEILVEGGRPPRPVPASCNGTWVCAATTWLSC